MSEWWTYSLSDFLLFSPRTYHRLFELYNAQVWPAQPIAVAIGLTVLVRLLRAWTASGVGAGPAPATRGGNALFPDRASAALFAVCWAWVAWAFHLERYATINWAAPAFAAAFGVQALLLATAGLMPRAAPTIPANAPGTVSRRTGLALFSFALFIQPFLAPLLGRSWTQTEVFGIAPDPTVLATLGLLLFARGGRWALLWPIPLAWCAISGATLWTMGSPDALLMPMAGIAALSIRLADWRSSMRTSA